MAKPKVLVNGSIIDLTHEFTDPIYRFIQTRPLLLRIIIILLGIHINLSVSVVVYYLVVKQNFYKLVLMVFLSKVICNTIYHSPPPEGRSGEVIKRRRLHWSIHSQPETFFSGHTALCALAISVVSGPLKMALILGSILTITTIILLRVHYIIDIIGSLLVVHFFYTKFM